MPEITDMETFEVWEKKGSKSIAQVAKEKTEEILATHKVEPPLPIKNLLLVYPSHSILLIDFLDFMQHLIEGYFNPYCSLCPCPFCYHDKLPHTQNSNYQKRKVTLLDCLLPHLKASTIIKIPITGRKGSPEIVFITPDEPFPCVIPDHLILTRNTHLT